MDQLGRFYGHFKLDLLYATIDPDLENSDSIFKLRMYNSFDPSDFEETRNINFDIKDGVIKFEEYSRILKIQLLKGEF